MREAENLGEYILREATLDDIPVLVRQRRVMSVETTDPKDEEILDAMDKAYKEYIEKRLPAGIFRAWLIETKTGKIIAGCGLSIFEQPPRPDNYTLSYVYLHSLYTEPEYRRQGLARALITKIVQWCRENGFKTVTCRAMPAIRLVYESLGFVPMPEM